jgi:hypothetical protein
MSFASDYLAQLEAFAATGPLPRVRALHLPPPPSAEASANKGEFCALELDDGSLGLSYVLLDDTLARLRADGDGLGLAGRMHWPWLAVTPAPTLSAAPSALPRPMH